MKKVAFGEAVLDEGALVTKGLVNKKIGAKHWANFLNSSAETLPLYFVVSIKGEMLGEKVDVKFSGNRLRMASYLEDISPGANGVVRVIDITTDRNKARSMATEV
jgi:hypothetical protein